MKKEKVSIPVVRRLPRYYRYLSELMKNQILKTSSCELSNKMGLTASQIRQDFNCFGGFGQQGYGYNVELLHDEIGAILGLKDLKNIVIVGAGNLGSALAKHIDFEKRGFNLTGIFDVNPTIIGKKINNKEIKDFSKIADCFAKYPPNVAVLTVPRDVENVHLGDSLMTLSYRISNHREDEII
jgi:redox-sensing transcriptional repressor